MRQLELTHFRSPSRRKKPLAPPPPEQVLTDEVMREVVRLMAQKDRNFKPLIGSWVTNAEVRGSPGRVELQGVRE